MALTTVRDLINSSLLLAGAINKGESPDADEFSDACDVLNSMLGSWETEQLILPYIASAQYLTQAGISQYAIGPTSVTWTGVRPTTIIDAWVQIGTLTLPLNQLQFDQFGNIPVKSVANTFPTDFMYNASYPDGYLVLYPVPTSVVTIILSYNASFGAVDLNTSITTLPPGYIHAIRYGLASLIPAEYGKNVPKKIETEAIRSKGVIKSLNLKPLDAIVDQHLPVYGRSGLYNWLTDNA